MKRLILTMFAFSMVFSIGFTQSFSVQKKATEPLRDRVSLTTFGLKLIGDLDENFYYLHLPQKAVEGRGKNTYQISRYDKNLQLLTKEPVDVNYQKARMELESALILDDKLYTITSFHNTKTKKHYLFARQLNNSTLKPSGSLKLIAELDYKDHPRLNRTRIRIELSEDKTKLMVFYTFVTAENSVIKYAIYVYDNELELFWKNEDVKRGVHTEGIFTYERFKVSNQGEVYLLGKNFDSREAYDDKATIRRIAPFRIERASIHKSEYTYNLYYYSIDYPNGDYVELNLQDQFIRDLNFKLIGNRNIIFYGIYSDHGFVSAKGAFIFHYDFNRAKMSDLQITTIDSKLVTECFNEHEIGAFQTRSGNDEEWDPFEYSLSELMLRANGDYYFVAEQTLAGTITQESGKTKVTSSIYYYYDLFVFNMPSNFSTLTYHRIPKRNYWQISSRHGSYAVTEHNEALYFLYNELPRQIKYGLRTRVGSSYIARLHANGDVEKVAFHTQLPVRSLIISPATAVILPEGGFIHASLQANYSDYAFERVLFN